MAGTPTQCAQPLLRRLMVKAGEKLQPRVCGEREGMEPAEGTPGWENGVSAQTRGPGVRRGRTQQGKGDKYTCWEQGVKELGHHRQHTDGGLSPISAESRTSGGD